MPCTITFTLLQESLTGDVGNDWQYTVRADILDPMVYGSGLIEIPEHQLRPGATQRPPNGDTAVELDGGEQCGAEVRVRLTLEATEVDWLIDDNATNVTVASVQCPTPGAEPTVTEAEIAAHVKEAPGFQGGLAVLTVKVRLVGRCG
jgi:hypothetical protein